KPRNGHRLPGLVPGSGLFHHWAGRRRGTSSFFLQWLPARVDTSRIASVISVPTLPTNLASPWVNRFPPPSRPPIDRLLRPSVGSGRLPGPDVDRPGPGAAPVRDRPHPEDAPGTGRPHVSRARAPQQEAFPGVAVAFAPAHGEAAGAARVGACEHHGRGACEGCGFVLVPHGRDRHRPRGGLPSEYRRAVG